jgi:hypothetical protein
MGMGMEKERRAREGRGRGESGVALGASRFRLIMFDFSKLSPRPDSPGNCGASRKRGCVSHFALSHYVLSESPTDPFLHSTPLFIPQVRVISGVQMLYAVG